MHIITLYIFHYIEKILIKSRATVLTELTVSNSSRETNEKHANY